MGERDIGFLADPQLVVVTVGGGATIRSEIKRHADLANHILVHAAGVTALLAGSAYGAAGVYEYGGVL